MITDDDFEHLQSAMGEFTKTIGDMQDAMVRVLVRVTAILQEALEPMTGVMLRCMIALQEEYKQQGCPYGDTPDGLDQWIAAMTDEAEGKADEDYRAAVAEMFRTGGRK